MPEHGGQKKENKVRHDKDHNSKPSIVKIHTFLVLNKHFNTLTYFISLPPTGATLQNPSNAAGGGYATAPTLSPFCNATLNEGNAANGSCGDGEAM